MANPVFRSVDHRFLWSARLRSSRFFCSLALLSFAAQAQTLSPIVIGHEYRQDDLPALAAAPDGSLWAAWLSFDGNRDDVAIRRYRDNKWENLQWVPGTSGDSWLPQIGVDSQNRVWVVWSQQMNGNWDLFARRFGPAAQDWGPLERLTSDPLPAIHPRLASDGKGHFALVWQGFRKRESGRPSANIFLKIFDGEKWSGEIRLTDGPANDWEPAVAIDTSGTVRIVYDTYRVPIRVKLQGANRIATVAVIRDGVVIYTLQPNQPKAEFDFKDTNAPAGNHYYYVRAQQQDKMMAWSSPMFVTYRGAR